MLRPTLMTTWLTNQTQELASSVRIVMLARLMEWSSTIAKLPFFDRLYRVISTGLREF